MDTGNILKPSAHINQSLISKTLRLLSCWILAEVVLIGAVLNFLDRLNQKGILGMGADFSPSQLFWGDGIWMNIFRLVIFVFFAGVFGFLYGYLSKKITMSEKIIVNTINAFLSVFGAFFLILLMVLIFRMFKPEIAGEINSTVSIVLNIFVSSPFYLTFLILNLIGSFVFGFFCVELGIKTINNPYHALDREKSGTLLGIKWYHYFWLWVPIGFYGQVFLNLIYATGYALITFIRNVHWFEFLGVSDGSKQNSLDIAYGRLFGIFIAVIIICYLLVYLREVLAGEKRMHWALKILVSVVIGLVIPILLLLFTVLGS